MGKPSRAGQCCTTWFPGLFSFLSAGLLAAATLPAQELPRPDAPSITVQSQLVLLPTEVRTKSGDILYGLHADDFSVEVDGVPQAVRLDDSDQPPPLSLVVLFQCSREAFREGPKTSGLGTMVEALVGASPARVAVVDFGKELELLTGLTEDQARRNVAFGKLQPCYDDPGAGIYDALAYANKLLDRDHATGRRLILLVSETRDHGSAAKASSVIESLNRSNTMVESVSFSPGRDAMVEDVKASDGAAGGVLGLIGTALQALRKNAPKEFARETGGEYINFASKNGFDRSLNTLTNRLHNGYRLSFVPHLPPGTDTAGLHEVRVRVTKYPDAILRHRSTYWAGPPESVPPASH